MTSHLRVAAIHDLSGYGRCSLSVVMPILSAMGIQCCPLPTAYLSAHTGFNGSTFHDMSDVLLPAVEHWQTLGLPFAAVYSGFLGSSGQIDIVCEIIRRLRVDGCLVVVDPVMGDHGRLYRTITPEMCTRMADLASCADLITPNLTEAALLLGLDATRTPDDQEEVFSWVKALSHGGRKSVVITGITTTSGLVGSVYFDAVNRKTGIYNLPFVGQEYQGTGDLFASILTGKLTHGEVLAEAVRAAAEFVRDCAALSYREGTDPKEGVRFEAILDKLVH